MARQTSSGDELTAAHLSPLTVPGRAKAEPSVVLDFGSGSGNVTVQLLEYLPGVRQLVGFDLSENMVQYARDRHQPKLAGGEPDPRVRFAQADVAAEFDQLSSQIQLPAASVDICFSVYVLHWVYERSRALSNIRRLLKPGTPIFQIRVQARWFKKFYQVYSFPVR